MREVYTLVQVYERWAGAGKTTKYFANTADSATTARAVAAIDAACDPCPKRRDCLPAKAVNSEGTLKFRAHEALSPGCRIPESDRGGSLQPDLTTIPEPRYSSPISRILGA